MTITLTREEAQQACEVPLVELLESVPKDARLCVDDSDGMGTSYFPIGRMCHEAAETLRTRLSAPEPEPLIKMKELLEVQGREGNWNLDPYMQGMYNGMELMVGLAEGRDPVFRKAPEKWLSAPPQREWQGLTDEEKEDVLKGSKNAYDAIERIEAKLKEKNS
jgi:hypothetical protein